jgi:CBS domain-containing protein
MAQSFINISLFDYSIVRNKQTYEHKIYILDKLEIISRGVYVFLAEDIMTKKVVSVSPDVSIKTIAEKMSAKNISSLIVVDNKKPIGIISERDIVQKTISSKRALTAKSIMSSPVLSIQPRDSVSNAAKLMKENNIRHLLVTENNTLKGIISETDVLRGETEFVKTHQFLQNLIMALFVTILVLFVIVFRVRL